MNEHLKFKTIGFIGCGHMASAIIKGILAANFVAKSEVKATCSNNEHALQSSIELGIEVATDNKYIAANSDVIVLAVKPSQIASVVNEIKSEINLNKLVISIAAGVSTKSIENMLQKEVAVVRVMPNAPAMVLEGMSGIAKGRYASQVDLNYVKEFFENIGKCLIVDEDKIEIVTAISGSGPAFFYKTINEIARAGEKLGLMYNEALLLSIQTAIGSAKIMMNSSQTPDELIEKISTKGGCTEVGVACMNNANSKDMFDKTIKQTYDKAKSLG